MGMNKQVVKNAELDRIADSLLKRSALKYDEIDEIVARRDLFLSVKRRVVGSENRRPISGPALVFRPRVLSYASLVVVAVITVISAVEAIVNRNNGLHKAAPTVVRAPESPTRQKEQPNFAQSTPQQDEKETSIQQAVYRPRLEKPTVKGPYHPPRNTAPEEQPLEFYALADMSSMEPVTGGRVVRVDLPRASLVSLGVNIPLGSDKQIIKTDLLIGPDGVPRAIRLVE